MKQKKFPITLGIRLTLALAAAPAGAAPVTANRINGLAAPEQAVWKSYLEKSLAAASAERQALQAELVANGMTSALRPPDGGDFKLKSEAGDPWFGGTEAGLLADAIVSYQTPSGGWSKHLGFARGPRKPGMQWTSQSEPGEPFHYAATFDNHSTTAEMALLAGVWLATKRDDCKDAFLKGMDFISASQYPDGGWPQVYPLEGGYHDDITLNDDAMTNVLMLLHDIGSGAPCYAFLDDVRRKQAATSLAKGLDCVLRTQVVQNGKKTVWCAQMDPLTLQPSSARKMEPATLSGLESAKLLKFLMTIPSPSPELVTCIDGGLKWFDEVKISDPATGKIQWARFYDLTTGKPVFPGRDGVLYNSFAAMAAENKLGYDYMTTLPGSIVTNGQKKWRKTLADR